MINNNEYGGFIVSKNILKGERIKYSYREKSDIKKLNGWTLYSEKDDDEYVMKAENFVILTAESLYNLSPTMLEIFEAPYGTNLCWIYDDKEFLYFYDLSNNKAYTLRQLKKRWFI